MSWRQAPETDQALVSTPDWYRDAVIYQLHVKSFFDSNDDGIGDFAGLLSRLDYIVELGADTLWLLPFYPSPRRDDGYDVADYLGVSPDYGSLEDVRTFIAAAHARGLRVLGDLVLNHTSDAHPWFQRARRESPESEAHAFYVWSDSDQRYPGTRIIFPDVEKSNWTWDPIAGRYYFHRFYSHQPDLNYDNPQVLEAMIEVMRFWLDAGFDGFRLDAVAYLVERDGSSNENLPETHAILKRLRAEIDAHYPDRVLLAEANQWPEDMQDYFGADDECHMAFHFPLMPRMYMALAQEDRFPVTDILRQTPPTPAHSQWAIFLRNHDELTLEMVTDAERDYLWNTYAADPRARLNLGIRRRLAPLLERDRRRIELMTALLLTLPGTPVMYYGDEIGMGDNIHLGDRDGVRTPMQWSVDRNGGFSRADTQRLVLPTIMDPLYGYQAVNVESQQRDPHSLLHWIRNLLRVRRRYGSLFGRGAIRFLHPRNRRVLVYLREYESVRLMCVVNLARTLQAVELDLAEFEGRIPLDALGGAALPAVAATAYPLTLPPYGVYLLELTSRDQLPDWHVPEPESAAELPTLVLRDGLAQELETVHRLRLEQELLPPWLARNNSRGEHARGLPTHIAAVRDAGAPDSVLLSLQGDDSRPAAFPLGVLWEGEASGMLTPANPLARVRRGSRTGLLIDALANPRLLRDWRNRWQADAGASQSVLRFTTEPGAALPEPRELGLEPIGESSSLQAVLLDGGLLITLARGSAGSLTGPLQILQRLSRRGHPQSLPLLGVATVQDVPAPYPILIAQSWRAGQGDAMQWTLDFLRRTLHEYRAAAPECRTELLQAYLPFARMLGTRLAELHVALAAEFGCGQSGSAQAAGASAMVQPIVAGLRAQATRLDAEAKVAVTLQENLLRRLGELESQLAAGANPDMFRVHGNLSLKNIRLTTDDLFFVNFESPAVELGFCEGHFAIRLSDVAEMLHGLAHCAAIIAIEEQDETADEFASTFSMLAERTVLQSYFSVRDPDMCRETAHQRNWIHLLMARRAALDLESASQPTTLTAAWRVLQSAVATRAARQPSLEGF